MSYQIKSTPFFRRLVATSKQNGELQRLKEEYDRIKEFNERSIEKKMRQVRLKRLFKEIEEIKESGIASGRRKRKERKKTQEDLRAEMIRRANELGKEYSKFNGLLRTGSFPRQTQSFSAVPLEKILAEKRINYGNNISRLNMQKMGVTKKISHTFSDTPKVVQSSVMYKKRIQYGNGCMKRFMSNVHGTRLANSSKLELQHQTEPRETENIFGRKNFSLPRKSMPLLLPVVDSDRARNNWHLAMAKIVEAIDEVRDGSLNSDNYTLALTTTKPFGTYHGIKSAHSRTTVTDDGDDDVEHKSSETSISSYHESSSELIGGEKYESISQPNSAGMLDFKILDEDIAKLDVLPILMKPRATVPTKYPENMPDGKDDYEFGVKGLRRIFENQD